MLFSTELNKPYYYCSKAAINIIYLDIQMYSF